MLGGFRRSIIGAGKEIVVSIKLLFLFGQSPNEVGIAKPHTKLLSLYESIADFSPHENTRFREQQSNSLNGLLPQS